MLKIITKALRTKSLKSSLRAICKPCVAAAIRIEFRAVEDGKDEGIMLEKVRTDAEIAKLTFKKDRQESEKMKRNFVQTLAKSGLSNEMAAKEADISPEWVQRYKIAFLL